MAGFEPATCRLTAGCSTTKLHLNNLSTKVYRGGLADIWTTMTTGVEPATSAVTGQCSNQLNYAIKITCTSLYEMTYCGGWDLNPRPLAYEANELPDCSTPLLFYTSFEEMAEVGFEPTTSSL